jgi:alkylhydroperoxidase family enzyme
MTEHLAVTDTTFAELERALSKETLTDLIITIAFYNAVVRYLGAMQIDVEPEYRKYLEAFPLPNS